MNVANKALFHLRSMFCQKKTVTELRNLPFHAVVRNKSIFTASKRSLRHGNIFTGVCLSIGGWLPSMHHRSHDQGVCIEGEGVCNQGVGACIQGYGVCIQGESAFWEGRGSASEWVCMWEGLGRCPTGTWKAGSRHPTRTLSCYVKNYCTFAFGQLFS